jgi:putative solute:sodium symporter small subunit
MGEKASGNDARTRYWRANLRLMGVLLFVWFAVSFGFGILLREQLDAVSIGGVPLGFWFAQQGAIYVFVALIFIYCVAANRLEAKFEAELGDD